MGIINHLLLLSNYPERLNMKLTPFLSTRMSQVKSIQGNSAGNTEFIGVAAIPNAVHGSLLLI